MSEMLKSLNRLPKFPIFTSLAKEVYVFGSVGLSVCLFVCLSVDNITQKVMNGLG